MDVADGRVLHRHRAAARRHGGVGIRLAWRQSACRHPAFRDDARRPAFCLAAWQRLYPSRLAGSDGTQPVVGSRSLRSLRHGGVPLRIEGELLERRRQAVFRIVLETWPVEDKMRRQFLASTTALL